MTLAEKLKAETSEHHMAVEALANGSDITNHSISIEDYKEMLVHNYRFHAPLEGQAKCNPFLAALYAEGKRLKTPHLKEDFRSMGMPVPTMNPFFGGWSTSSLLGAVYVAEGSMLGGQIIGRALTKNTKITEHVKHFAFYNAYGDRLGLYWTEFLNVLNQYPSKHDGEVIEGAKNAFGIFRKIITETRVV